MRIKKENKWDVFIKRDKNFGHWDPHMKKGTNGHSILVIPITWVLLLILIKPIVFSD